MGNTSSKSKNNIVIDVRQTRQSLEHVKDVHDDHAHQVAKLWLVPKAVMDVKKKLNALAKGKDYHKVSLSKFESHARDQQYHMKKVFDRRSNTHGYNLPSHESHSWHELHHDISPSKLSLSISKHHFSEETNLALDAYKQKR